MLENRQKSVKVGNLVSLNDYNGKDGTEKPSASPQCVGGQYFSPGEPNERT